MKVYTYSEARQQLAELLNRARREGQVEIRRWDGQTFVVRSLAPGGSPLDVPGVDTALSRGDLVQLVRESRRSPERFVRGKTRRERSPGRVSKPTGAGRKTKQEGRAGLAGRRTAQASSLPPAPRGLPTI
jgi:hypothetical protein